MSDLDPREVIGMTMAELKAELTNIADHFMILATEQREKDQGISYQAFHVSEICRQIEIGRASCRERV